LPFSASQSSRFYFACRYLGRDPRRQRDYDEGKTGAQAIYLPQSRAHAEAAFRRFRARWLRLYGPMVRRLERDLPELLSVFAFPPHLWTKLRERCFVEVR
jgi:transposase-like protein